MNALERYFDEVEKAPRLAERVGCSHTTLYRIAAGRTRARKDLARRIEEVTAGRVSRQALRAIADQAEDASPEPGGDPGIALGSGEASQEGGEVEGCGSAAHDETVADAAVLGQREGFSP